MFVRDPHVSLGTIRKKCIAVPSGILRENTNPPFVGNVNTVTFEDLFCTFFDQHKKNYSYKK